MGIICHSFFASTCIVRDIVFYALIFKVASRVEEKEGNGKRDGWRILRFVHLLTDVYTWQLVHIVLVERYQFSKTSSHNNLRHIGLAELSKLKLNFWK